MVSGVRNALDDRAPQGFSDEDLTRRELNRQIPLIQRLFSGDQRPFGPRKMDEKGNAYELINEPGKGYQWWKIDPEYQFRGKPVNRGLPVFGADHYEQMKSPFLPTIPGEPY